LRIILADHLSLPCLRKQGSDILIALHVQPRASKNGVCGFFGDALKVRLTSPPVDGAANKLCCRFIAGLFGVAKGRVEIASGEKSRSKTLRIRDLSLDDAVTSLKLQL